MPDSDSGCTACAVSGSPKRSSADGPVIVGSPPDDEIKFLDKKGEGEYVYSYKEYVEADDDDLYEEGEFQQGEYDYSESDESDGDTDDDTDYSFEEFERFMEEDEDEDDESDASDDRKPKKKKGDVVMFIKGIQAGFDPESGKCKDVNGRFIKCPE